MVARFPRQVLANYANQVCRPVCLLWISFLPCQLQQVGAAGQGAAEGDSSTNLQPDLAFYQRMAFKVRLVV